MQVLWSANDVTLFTTGGGVSARVVSLWPDLKEKDPRLVPAKAVHPSCGRRDR